MVRRLQSAILVSAVCLILAVAAAAGPQERLGTRINLLDTPTTFAANQPFHVAHGWFIDPSRHDANEAVAAGLSRFGLEIDGVAQQPDFVERSVDQERRRAGIQFLSRTSVFNFPSGLPAGTYTFTGVWSGGCEKLLLSGFDVAPCAYPAEVKEVPLSRTLTFTS